MNQNEFAYNSYPNQKDFTTRNTTEQTSRLCKVHYNLRRATQPISFMYLINYICKATLEQ